jgi:hypothetical protein
MAKRPALSKGEMVVARLLWDHSPATVRQIHTALPSPQDMDFSTVHRQRARRRPQLRRAYAATDLACARYRGIDPGRSGVRGHQPAALPEGHSGLLGRATAHIDRGGLNASPHRFKAHSSVSSQRATPVAVASGPRSFRLRAGDTPRDVMVRFFMSLPLAFFAKTSRRLEITKVPCFIGFPSTGRVGGRPVVLSL